MIAKQSVVHAGLVQAIAASGRGLKLPYKLPVSRSAFLENYYAQTDQEDLAADPRALAAAALGHLHWAENRKAKTAKIRVFNPTLERDRWSSEHTIVETVNDNMPFLVDSVTMTLNQMGHGVHVTIHPVFRVERDSHGKLIDVRRSDKRRSGKTESLMHIEIVRETRPEALDAIARALEKTLRDVRAAVEDWRAMANRLRMASLELRANDEIASEITMESCEFLDWLADDHFTLLGYRESDLSRGDKSDELQPRAGTGLGILREGAAPAHRMTLTGQARRQARSRNPLVITKANAQSTVHRPAPLDYIGVKVFDEQGRPCAERRFLGLFTSVAYNESPKDIPLLRMKVRQVLDASGLDPVSHRGKALRHILDTFPRDDLIQGSVEDLEQISIGILGLQERRRLSLFSRRDVFGRFYSCLVYLPRDQYSFRARRSIESILKKGLNGESVRSELTISESALARITVTVKTDPGLRSKPDFHGLQTQLQEAVRTWSDKVRQALLADLPESRALELFDRFVEHFPAAYHEAVDAKRASRDIQKLAQLLDGGLELEMTLRPSGAPADNGLLFTTFNRDEPIQLYLAHPILENMGLKVISESNHVLQLRAGSVWIQDFELQAPTSAEIEPGELAPRFQECFARTLDDDVENDGFNSFVVTAGLDWRQAALLRAYCKYLLQTNIHFSQPYIREVLARYPNLCRALIDQFGGLFDPSVAAKARDTVLADAERSIHAELERTVSLDEDRILRAFASAVSATLRTNFFQLDAGQPKRYMSFKLDPSGIPELPRPCPMFEIFVYSRRMEGLHLRCGKIARGGLRWSDRREDFRTEILGLMKAQLVKNTVIVPTGAKGGFVCKALPEDDREAARSEVVHCYRTLIRGLLDITDNIVDGQVVTPPDVVTRDEPDPYLVVAADKGTATFSDVANDLAAEYRFWLGDAFASGGSSGYDHKKMGITARGAWEGVKRHFREMGVDTQAQDFTVIGIGDMSGDVFGNGMLLSRHIKLLAAFNHQHIFIDPDPDPAESFRERQRLFEAPSSSWDDYDREKISTGGAVYSRSSKAIELHPTARSMLGLDRAKLTPPDLIRAILRARADLLWNGGIGTYVKASSEAHVDAGDPANDAVRVDASELKCKVIGEGGNLGLTQRGRIEFALRGGRINTDFIDNSGGVDSSDREVNIKILLNDAIRRRKLARKDRNALLAEMTDAVTELVLANNYAQTQALSMMASRAKERVGEHARLMRILEAQGLLDRSLEYLPGEEQIDERRKLGLALTRPELAVILSYAKIQLSTSLVATDIPDDPFCDTELDSYFPEQLTTRFGKLIQAHPLKREMIATLVASRVINRMGPFFVLRAQEETGADVAQITRAIAIVRETFGTAKLWRNIEALDNAVQAEIQYDGMFQISRMVRRAVYWVLQRYPAALEIDAVVARLGPGVTRLLDAMPELLIGRTQRRFDSDTRQFERLGLPLPIAKQIASLSVMTQILDIVEIAGERNLNVLAVARLHFELGRGVRLDWIREQIEQLRVEGRWRAMARATLRESLALEQRALVRAVLDSAGKRDPARALTAWLGAAKAQIQQTQKILDEIRTSGQMDFATLSVALKEIGRLVSSSVNGETPVDISRPSPNNSAR